jgi:trans-2-enoyl-CoA reductase
MQLLLFFENHLQPGEQPRLVQPAALEKKHKAGLYAKSVNGDAFFK